MHAAVGATSAARGVAASTALVALSLLVALAACGGARAHARTVARAADPVCGPPGTRSGAPGRAVPWDDARVASQAPAAVVGRVVDVTGRPATRGNVVLRRGPRDSVPRRQLLDSTGAFVLWGVAPADYRLEVRALGFQEQTHELRVLAGAADTLCVRVRAWPMGLPPIWP